MTPDYLDFYAHPGWFARFSTEDGTHTRPVVRWDMENMPWRVGWVAGDETKPGELTPATSWHNFDGYVPMTREQYRRHFNGGGQLAQPPADSIGENGRQVTLFKLHNMRDLLVEHEAYERRRLPRCKPDRDAMAAFLALPLDQSWADLVVMVPGLATLADDIRAIPVPDEGPVCANVLWYAPPEHGPSRKGWLCDLVGDDAHGHQAGGHNPILCTSAAYDDAYEYLYALLPDCRECQCMAPF